jgi:hypothetical protein
VHYDILVGAGSHSDVESDHLFLGYIYEIVGYQGSSANSIDSRFYEDCNMLQGCADVCPAHNGCLFDNLTENKLTYQSDLHLIVIMGPSAVLRKAHSVTVCVE